MEDVARAGDVARVVSERTAQLIAALADLADDDLLAPSELPGWSRLTIVCHLRYGAAATLRMTRDVLAGRETAYYPEGRAKQRPSTLRQAAHERPADVLASWGAIARKLDAEWMPLQGRDWATTVSEPADNPDLGPVPLGRLALARLLEVDVHGTDLGIGFSDWSQTLVEVAFPTRLHWLVTRRTNHRSFDASIRGSWLLEAGDGAAWLVCVEDRRASCRPADPVAERADAAIAGSGRDLLALLLGRPTLEPLRITGDVNLGASFSKAFPGP